MYFMGDDGLPNVSVYQPTFGMLQWQKYKGTDTDIIFLYWFIQKFYCFSFSPQYTHFLHSIKFNYKI